MMDSLYRQGHTTDDSLIKAELGDCYDPRYEVMFYFSVVRPVDTQRLIDRLLTEDSLSRK